MSCDHSDVIRVDLTGRWLPRASEADFQPDRIIGTKTCAQCGAPLFDHCTAHVWPCCPGRCTT